MKKDKILFSVLALVLTALTAKTVYAEYYHVELDFLKYNNGDRNLYVYKHINNDDPYYRISASGKHAYCMEVGKDLEPGDYDAEGITLESYLGGKVSANKITNLVNQLNNYLYFGYKDGDAYSNSNETARYELATQKLIWDALYDAGYRTEQYNKNIVYYLGEYPFTDPTTPQFTPYSAKRGDVSVETEMNAIKSKISTYKKTPSLCSSSTKLEIALGETATYTDTNKVLSQFEVKCSDGITCKVEGNNLKVTATKVGADHKITFTKNGAGTGAKVYSAPSQQSIVIGEGKVAPVSCDFGIDTYENVQTGSFKLLILSLVGLISFFVGYIIFASKDKKEIN